MGLWWVGHGSHGGWDVVSCGGVVVGYGLWVLFGSCCVCVFLGVAVAWFLGPVFVCVFFFFWWFLLVGLVVFFNGFASWHGGCWPVSGGINGM